MKSKWNHGYLKITMRICKDFSLVVIMENWIPLKKERKKKEITKHCLYYTEKTNNDKKFFIHRVRNKLLLALSSVYYWINCWKRHVYFMHIRLSTFVLVYFSWLLDHAIYLKLRLEQINNPQNCPGWTKLLFRVKIVAI